MGRKIDLDRFNDYLCEQNDNIDNASFEVLKYFDECAEWDMNSIGEVNDVLKKWAEDVGVFVCHPYYEECEDPDNDPNYDPDNDGVPCVVKCECGESRCPFLKQES